MKSFLQFINESAAQQAARLGLVGDGHGGWYDKATGEFTAKTESYHSCVHVLFFVF